jgi:hypothetical protein
MVDSVYGTPCACAAVAAPISPSACIIRVYPVGASASGIDASRPNSDVCAETSATSTSSRGWNRHRSSAASLAASDISVSAAPST